MQKRITNARGIRLRGHGYGTTRCISFGHHELDLLDTWEELADQTFLSKSGVFKRFPIVMAFRFFLATSL